MKRVLPIAAAALLVAVRPAGATLLEDHLAREPFGVDFGPGQTRLDGMGLRFAAPDENNEINLSDYGDNPAGLLADRDSWSVDTRFDHRERFDRDPDYAGNEYRGNIYSFLAAFRKTGSLAIGMGIDVLDGNLNAEGDGSFNYGQTRYSLLYNQMLGKLSAALEFRYTDENEDRTSGASFYTIEHNSGTAQGVLGVSYPVGDWLSVAGRGALQKTQIDGRAHADSYDDSFDWSQPSGSLEGQLYVDRPRLKGAVIYGRLEGAGEEMIHAQWSPLFQFNPGNYFVEFEASTFTQENNVDQFRTRWSYDLVPDTWSLSALYSNTSQTYDATANPVVIGSLGDRSLSNDGNEFAFGGSGKLVNQRLLVGAEFSRGEATLTDKDPLNGYEEKTSVTQVNLGAEFLATEDVAVRSGVLFRNRNNDDSVPDPSPDYDARRQGDAAEQVMSFGVGWIPSGGVVQIDAAYSVGIGSDYDLSQNHIAFAARVLF